MKPSENVALVEIESHGESDAHGSFSSCPDESSDKGNTRKKKASSTKQRTLKDSVTKQRKVSNKGLHACEPSSKHPRNT